MLLAIRIIVMSINVTEKHNFVKKYFFFILFRNTHTMGEDHKQPLMRRFDRFFCVFFVCVCNFKSLWVFIYFILCKPHLCSLFFIRPVAHAQLLTITAAVSTSTFWWKFVIAHSFSKNNMTSFSYWLSTAAETSPSFIPSSAGLLSSKRGFWKWASEWP